MPEASVTTLMAFDYGARKIGVAVGQTLTRTATGITSVRSEDRETCFERIGELIGEWRPAALIVGLPLDSEGRETASSRAAREFGDSLGKRFGLPVYWVNEYLTSQAAQAQLTESMQAGKRFSQRRQAGRDLLAAELILRSHLESKTARS